MSVGTEALVRNLSNNNYIASADKSALGLSIFDGVLPKKHLSENEMHTVVRDFLARLKFDIHTVGYKYWAKLLQLYLVRDDYNQECGSLYILGPGSGTIWICGLDGIGVTWLE